MSTESAKSIQESGDLKATAITAVHYAFSLSTTLINHLYRPPFPAFSPADSFSMHQSISRIGHTYNFQNSSRDDRRKAWSLLEGNAPQRPITERDECVLLSVRQSGLMEAHRVEDVSITSPDCRVPM